MEQPNSLSARLFSESGLFSNAPEKEAVLKLFGQIVGWTILSLGGLAALFLGPLSLFYFGLGGYGVIVALGYLLPAFLLALVVCGVGRLLLNHANDMPSPGASTFYSRVNSANHPFLQKPSPKKELS
jgi:hypothetical protein